MSEENKIEEKASYVGPRKVSHVVIEEFKTYGGNDVVTVHYSGGYKEIMPKDAYENLVDDKPIDFTVFGAKKIKLLTRDILAVIAEHHLRGDEIESLSNSITNELYNSFNKATHILWKGESNSFTPGANAVLDCSLLEAHRIITLTPDVSTEEPKTDNK